MKHGRQLGYRKEEMEEEEKKTKKPKKKHNICILNINSPHERKERRRHVKKASCINHVRRKAEKKRPSPS